MARTRTIKPEFWTDEKIGSLPIEARLFFIGLWAQADDYGVVKGNPVLLKSLIFPYDEGLKVNQIKDWLTRLVQIRALIPFQYNGEQYYYIRTFRTHQMIHHPSKQRNIPQKVLDNKLKSLSQLQENPEDLQKVTKSYGKFQKVSENFRMKQKQKQKQKQKILTLHLTM